MSSEPGSGPCLVDVVDVVGGDGQHGSLDTGDLLGKPEVFGQSDVSGHWASRSSSSLSRSSSLRARSVKSLSARTRSISSARDSTISALTLVP